MYNRLFLYDHSSTSTFTNLEMDQAQQLASNFVAAQSELKELLMENKEVLAEIKRKRRVVSELKTSMQEYMANNNLSQIEADAITVRLEPKNAVKHDVETLKRIVGNEAGEEYLQEITEKSSTVKVQSERKKRRS